MDRRQFLRTTAAGAAGLLIPGGLMAAPTPDIAVTKGQPGAATRAAVGLLGGMAAFVKPGQRVGIKPNMSFASPAEAGANTHPLVVQALARLCWEAGAASVLILDNTLAPSRLCLESSGIPEAAAAVRPGMVFAMDDAGLYREAAIPGGRVLTRSAVAREVLRADVLIAAPTAKSHSGTGVSLSLKGMWASLPIAASCTGGVWTNAWSTSARSSRPISPSSTPPMCSPPAGRAGRARC